MLQEQDQKAKEAEFERVKTEFERERDVALRKRRDEYVALYKSKSGGTTLEEDKAAVIDVWYIKAECKEKISAARKEILGEQ